MGLFYAYLKDTQYDEIYRYLITFVDRETADEWWRLISTSPGSPYAANVRRISPQFYIQSTTTLGNVATFFSRAELPDAKRFLERMFFTLLNDRDGRILSVAPRIKVTDHISGKWFFIRSQADPRKYWYFDTNETCLVCKDLHCDKIHVSTEYRTKFSIQARNLSKDLQLTKDLVLIGTDEISIAASKDYTLHINDAEELKATKLYPGGTSDLLFDDLKNRFVTRAVKVGLGGGTCEYVVPVERGLGEAWELAD